MSYLGKNTAHYGRIRSWGSIGFIVSVVGLGYAFDYIAIAWLLWAGLVCELGILIFSRQIPKTEVLAHHTDHQSIRKIVLQPRVLALFGACFLMSVAHGPYYTFYSIYLVEHGYAKSAVGGLWSLGVICEIGVFFVMPALVRRFGFTRILLVSFSAAVLRFLLIGWGVDWVVLLLLAQMLHALTFGAYHAASMGLVHEFFQGRHQSKGQALFGSVTYGAGGVLGGLASGPIWQHWGASVLYSMSAMSALLGLLLMVWMRNLQKS
jgi:PPP family 3-phenylpropionic acid transporter